VTVTYRSGGEHLGISATLRLGHREAGNDLAGQQRLEPALLLLGGAEVGEDFGVATVRCLAAEDYRSEIGATENLVHQAQLHLAESLSAQFRPQMAGPQATCLDLLL